MFEDFLKLFGVNLKKRIEETPGVMIFDLKRSKLDWELGELRIPVKMVFPKDSK